MDTPDNQYMIEEYRTLRDEILKRQEARIQITGFTYAAIAILVGVAVTGYCGNGMQSQPSIRLLLISMEILCGIIILTAVLFTINHTQHLLLIYKYINKYFESIPPLAWHGRWMKYRNSLKTKRSFYLYLHGTSRILGFCYLLILAGVWFVFYLGLTPLKRPEWFVSIIYIICALCCLDLIFNITSGFRPDWQLINENNKNQGQGD